MDSKDRDMVGRLMSRIDPIPCTYLTVKHGVGCPAYQKGDKICCWFCDYFETCVKGWPKKQHCQKYGDERWCSAVLTAYEKMK